MRDKLVELFAVTSLEFEDAVTLANYLIKNGVTIPVRCKDCMWSRQKDHRDPTETPRELICQCFKHHYIPAPWGARMAVSKDDFCSYGERKDNE